MRHLTPCGSGEGQSCSSLAPPVPHRIKQGLVKITAPRFFSHAAEHVHDVINHILTPLFHPPVHLLLLEKLVSRSWP
jgi:hypothetical protein